MKRVLKATCVALVVGVALFMAGCSGVLKVKPTQTPINPYAGTWVLDSVTLAGHTYTGSALDQVNITATLNLNPDGTASLDTMGQKATGTWKQKDATTITVTMAFIPTNVTIQGNTLVTTIAGAQVTLKKQ